MIAFKHTPIKDFLKKYNPNFPELEEIEKFQSHIKTLLDNSSKHHTERSQEEEMIEFFKEAFSYRTRNRHSIDLAILVDERVNVILEVKALNQKDEFPKETLHSKALYQSILYFLEQSIRFDNNIIKHIILCNPCEFYICDAISFGMFLKDKKIIELYNNCTNKEGVVKDRPKFYKDLEKYLKEGFEGELPYTHFF